jgi:arginine decarboxylase
MGAGSFAQIDRFLAFHSSRSDNWRAVVDACEAWAGEHCERSEVSAALADVSVIEEFHAVPGIRLMRELHALVDRGEAGAAAALARRIAEAIMTNGEIALAQDANGKGGDD